MDREKSTPQATAVQKEWLETSRNISIFRIFSTISA